MIGSAVNLTKRGRPKAVGEAMKAIVIGVLPQEKIRERVLAIARGDYKPRPSTASSS